MFVYKYLVLVYDTFNVRISVCLKQSPDVISRIPTEGISNPNVLNTKSLSAPIERIVSTVHGP